MVSKFKSQILRKILTWFRKKLTLSISNNINVAFRRKAPWWPLAVAFFQNYCFFLFTVWNSSKIMQFKFLDSVLIGLDNTIRLTSVTSRQGKLTGSKETWYFGPGHDTWLTFYYPLFIRLPVAVSPKGALNDSVARENHWQMVSGQLATFVFDLLGTQKFSASRWQELSRCK